MDLIVYRLNLTHFISEIGFELFRIRIRLKLDLELELLIVITLLLMIEKGTRGKIFPDNHRYVKANSRYMKYHDKKKESPHLKYNL